MVPTTDRKAVAVARKKKRATLAPPEGAALLNRAIALSGLPANRFAEDVLVVNERTVRRWLAREYPLPRVVRERLEKYIAQDSPYIPRHPTP